MAEDKPTKKRRIRGNPETFRQRAEKAGSGQEAKPKRISKSFGVIGKIFSPVLAPVGGFLKKLFRYQPFKAIGWLFKWIGRIVVPKYVRNSWKELRQVDWPNRRQGVRLTSAVLIFSVIFGALVALVDYGLDKLFKAVLLK